MKSKQIMRLHMRGTVSRGPQRCETKRGPTIRLTVQCDSGPSAPAWVSAWFRGDLLPMAESLEVDEEIEIDGTLRFRRDDGSFYSNVKVETCHRVESEAVPVGLREGP